MQPLGPSEISGGSLARSLHGHHPTDTLPSWTVLTRPQSSQIAQGRVARHLPDPTVISSHAHSWNQKPGTHSPLSPTPAASIPSFYILIQSWLTPSPSSHSHLPGDNPPSSLCHLGRLSPARPASRMWSPAGNPGAHSPSTGWQLAGHSPGHELQVHRPDGWAGGQCALKRSPGPPTPVQPPRTSEGLMLIKEVFASLELLTPLLLIPSVDPRPSPSVWTSVGLLTKQLI